MGFLMGPKGCAMRETEAASGCVVTVPRAPAKVRVGERELEREREKEGEKEIERDNVYA